MINVCLQFLNQFRDEFMEFLDESNEQVGSLGTTFRASFKWPPISSLQVPFNWSLDVIKHAVWLPKHYVRGIFDSSELLLLNQLYTHLYSVGSSDIEIPSSFFKYTSIRIFTNVLGAYKSRSSSSCVVMALWDSTFFINSHDNLASEKLYRPARINFFVKHTVSIKGKFTTHLLVSLSWYKHHPLQNHYGKPLSVWECDLFEMPGIYSYVPIQLVSCRTASLVDNISDFDPPLLFVVPLVDF